MAAEICTKDNFKMTHWKLSRCEAHEGRKGQLHFTLAETDASTDRTGDWVNPESRSGRWQEHRNILSLPRFEPWFMECYKMPFQVPHIFNPVSTGYCGNHCPYLNRERRQIWYTRRARGFLGRLSGNMTSCLMWHQCAGNVPFSKVSKQPTEFLVNAPLRLCGVSDKPTTRKLPTHEKCLYKSTEENLITRKRNLLLRLHNIWPKASPHFPSKMFVMRKNEEIVDDSLHRLSANSDFIQTEHQMNQQQM